MPATSNINTVAKPLTVTSTPGFTGVYVRPDDTNANYVTVGIGNTVTAALANLICTASDATQGFPLSNTSDILLPAAMFKAAGLTVDASYVYVISLATGQRVSWAIL